MQLLKNILLATSFSKSSDYVLADALYIAKTFKSKITPIYVLPNNIENEEAKELLKQFAIQQLNLIHEKIKSANVETSKPILEYGIFSDKITETAEKINANMVIIGAGEQLENDVFKLGANAEKIIKKSNSPVFVVKNEKQFTIKKILCPVDFSSESERAIKNAITLARRFKAQLVVFSVYEISHLYSIKHKIDLEEQIKIIRTAHEKEFAAFLDNFNLTGLDIIFETKQGVPDVEIIKAVDRHNSDLLIIGTTGRSGISKILMGSVTEKVIRKIPSAFITLKKEDIIVLELESKIKNIEDHYHVAQQLFEDGFFEESINEFKTCLDISFMHLPSIKGLVNAYKSIGDTTNEKKYKHMMTQVLDKMYNAKIESEIRKYRKD
jgi:nucleotide-binding universal stress UspA family protein